MSKVSHIPTTCCKMYRLCFTTWDMNGKRKICILLIKTSAMQRLRHLTGKTLYASVDRLSTQCKRYWNNYKKRTDWSDAPFIGRCSLRGIYFVFSPPAQRKRKPRPQNNTFANRCNPALQTQVCKRVVFFQHTLALFCSLGRLFIYLNKKKEWELLS